MLFRASYLSNGSQSAQPGPGIAMTRQRCLSETCVILSPGTFRLNCEQHTVSTVPKLLLLLCSLLGVASSCVISRIINVIMACSLPCLACQAAQSSQDGHPTSCIPFAYRCVALAITTTFPLLYFVRTCAEPLPDNNPRSCHAFFAETLGSWKVLDGSDGLVRCANSMNLGFEFCTSSSWRGM